MGCGIPVERLPVVGGSFRTVGVYQHRYMLGVQVVTETSAIPAPKVIVMNLQGTA
jgi:hypothetical protein